MKKRQGAKKHIRNALVVEPTATKEEAGEVWFESIGLEGE